MTYAEEVVKNWNMCKDKAMLTNPCTFNDFLESFLEAEVEVAKIQGFESQGDIEDYFHWNKEITESLLNEFEIKFQFEKGVVKND